jgi:hypothetical protein
MKTVQFYLLFFCSMLFVLFQSACGILDSSAKETEIAANIFATQTAQAPTDTPTPTITPTPTPTPTETPVPTATPTPTPAFSAVTLTLDDLPPGFEELSQDQMDLMFSQLGDMDIQSLFGFVGAGGFPLLMGFSTYVPDQQDQLQFDLVIRLLGETFAEVFSALMGFEGEFEVVEIPGVEIGDASSYYRMVFDEEGMSMTIEVLGFRHKEVGVLIMAVGYGEFLGDFSIEALAEILHQRLLNIYAQQ